jgi:polar amino acid transport system substrate-binding protein
MILPLRARFGFLALLLLVPAFLACHPSASRADTLADINKAGVINVGVFEDFPPFASAGPDMRLHGYDIDVATALAAELGVKLNLVAVTGQNRIPYLQDH